MLAVDANVVVRYLVGDHPAPSERARALFRDASIWVSATVLLETAWVLGKAYGYRPRQIVWALRLLGGLPTVTLQSADQMARALGWLERMDVADAVHLAQATDMEGFVTFDQGTGQGRGRRRWRAGARTLTVTLSGRHLPGLVDGLDQAFGRLGARDRDLAVEDHERHARDPSLVGLEVLARHGVLVHALGEGLQQA